MSAFKTAYGQRQRPLIPMLALLLLFGTAQAAIGQTVPGQADPLFETLADVQELIVRGENGAAEPLLIKALRDHPEDARVHNLLGVVMAQSNRIVEAEEAFLRAVELAPSFRGAYLNLGRLYQENAAQLPDAYDKGIRTYSRLLDLIPDQVESNYQIAVLYHRKGDFRRSQEHLQRLPQEDQLRTQTLALTCGNHAALQENALADAAADILASRPDLREEDLIGVLPALRSSGRADLALRLLSQLAAQELLQTETLEELAALYASAGQFEKAREILEDLSVRHPDLPGLLLKLAWVAYAAKDFEGALSYLAHARDVAPDNARVHLFFGLTCVELNLGLEALKSLEKAVSLEPENAYYNYALGAAILQWREAGEAIPYFEKYCLLRPDDPRGRAALGEAFFLHKDYDRARTEFERLVDTDETKAGALYYLGVIAKLELRIEDAEQYLSSSLEIYPENPHALAELGWVFTRKREFDAAERVLSQALSLDEKHFQANFNLLTLYSRTRDERFEKQNAFFEQLKQENWEKLTNSLRSIEAVPDYLIPGFTSPENQRKPW